MTTSKVNDKYMKFIGTDHVRYHTLNRCRYVIHRLSNNPSALVGWCVHKPQKHGSGGSAPTKGLDNQGPCHHFCSHDGLKFPPNKMWRTESVAHEKDYWPTLEPSGRYHVQASLRSLLAQLLCESRKSSFDYFVRMCLGSRSISGCKEDGLALCDLRSGNEMSKRNSRCFIVSRRDVERIPRVRVWHANVSRTIIQHN